MQCPKCNAPMRTTKVLGVETDRCPHCQGVWLDRGELELIEAKQIGRLVDLGSYSPRTPEQDEKPATCHRCGKPMISLVGAADIRFEWCDSCEGLFFDSGELTQLQEYRAD